MMDTAHEQQVKSTTKQPALYLAEYATPNEIAKAAIRVRKAGYKKWDCHTPYPLHGLDEVMGFKTDQDRFYFLCVCHDRYKHSGADDAIYERLAV